MLPFKVSLAGWPETCFPLELLLWCQPFYYSRFTSSGESGGGGTAAPCCCIWLATFSSSSHPSADVSAVLPQQGLFIPSRCLKQTAAKNLRTHLQRATTKALTQPTTTVQLESNPQPLGEEEAVHNVTGPVTNLWQLMWESLEVAVVTENSMKTNGWFRCE